ncbi:unnamed protein product [Caenorhabditis sp. 36 PRJEB53466]|nr:unnamed protein product [Caenorhabditis sp. 36 PRJEB53466]
MSDDEDDAQGLTIDENPPEDFGRETPVYSAPSSSFSAPKNREKTPEKVEEIEEKEPETEENEIKEDGELDEDEEEPMEINEQEEPEKPAEKSETLSQEAEKMEENEEEEEEEKQEESATPPPESSSSSSEKSEKSTTKKENGGMKPPQSTEKTRKRKESMENAGEKRKSGAETNSSSDTPSNASTPQRSKRASSHMATVAISACFNEEDIVSVPMMPIQRTPDTTPHSKRAKLSTAGASAAPATAVVKEKEITQRDATTNVITTKSVDTSGLFGNESVMEAPPGSQLMLEVTVMYRTKTSVAFSVKGTDLVGFLGDGLPPIANSAAAGVNNNKKKAMNDADNKDGRSSSASSNGRSTRGGSVARETPSKSEKGPKEGKGKRKKEEVEVEEMEEENQQVAEVYGNQKCELLEIELAQMHDCHFEECEKRFHKSSELEYHIAKNHKNRVTMFESMCSQTDDSLLDRRSVATEIDDELGPGPPMPVLKKESPIKIMGPGGQVYEDLSDDDVDQKPLDLLKAVSTGGSSSAPVGSSATAALMNIVQASTSAPIPILGAPQMRSANSTPAAKIGINPAMIAQVNAQKHVDNKQKSAFVTHSPRGSQPSSSSSSSTPSSQPTAVIQGHPMPQFLPPAGFAHPSLMHQSQMAALAAMDPRMVASLSQQQQQMTRTSSRAQLNDSHKIHELAKAKENAERQRQNTPKTPSGGNSGTHTPQRQFLPPHLMHTPGTPQSMQQQQQAAAAHQIMQMQMQMAAAQGRMMPAQPDLMMMLMGMNQFQMPPGSAAPPGFPPLQQQPPK